MEIINLTPLAFGSLTGRYNFPLHSLSIILKGTFDLRNNEPALLSEEQLFPTSDEYYPDDENKAGGPRYSSDFAYFKPRADLLLVGKCHTPDQKNYYSSQVKFQVGSKMKIIDVYGNRYWVGGFISNTSTKPEPFSEMELRYENGYGGEGYKKNPVGKGINKVKIKTGDILVPLPNILNPGENSASQGTQLEPAGLGPYGQMWAQRYSKLGSYKGNYLKDRWPWFAKDFDWGYFNAAPGDMQVSGYLKGDEKLYFENLHPTYSKYNSQLPGIKIRCFISLFPDKTGKDRTVSSTKEFKLFKEVKMNLDTLWVDIENDKLVLVWRGVTDIKTEDYEEIENLLVVSENISEQQKTEEYYQRLLEEKTKIPESEPEEPEEPQVDNEEEINEEIIRAEEEMRASLIADGIDPDKPTEQSEEDKKREAELLKEMGMEEEVDEVLLTRESFIQKADNKESFEERDLRGIDLSELDLQGLNFRGADLSGVLLKNSNLSNSDFTEANISKADLSGAKLNKSILNGTDFSGANLTKADLTGASVEGALFENALMHNSVLTNIKGKYSHFSGADLSQSNLINCELQGGDFSKSTLDGTNFSGSDLSEASFDDASVQQADFSKTILTKVRASGGNFTKTTFQECKGNEINWEKATLTETDFSYSDMESSIFTSALLEKANLLAGNMKFSRFTKAVLTSAILKDMNLFQGSFEKADLTKADCSGSNFYAVEFLDAIIKDTRFHLTNLKLTKLAK